ncbi:CNNM domain-containing protein [Verrucomicrobiota bacterium]
MTALLIIECFVLFFLVLCSAFFSSAETAFFSLDSIRIHRIRKLRQKAGERIESLLSVPDRLLSAILIGNTLVNITAAGLGYMIAESIWPAHGEAVSIPVMTILILIFGEIAPKRLAMAHAGTLAVIYSPVLSVLTRIMAPIRLLLEKTVSFLKKELRPSIQTLTEDEFLTVVEVGEEEGIIDKEERTMVDGIIRMEEIQASDVMTPRVDLVGIDLEDSLDESEDTARSVTFRFLPVYRESLDQAEGFLDVPQFLLSANHDLKAAVIPPFFVPETAPLNTLLATFKRENKRVAFVVDEYGGTAGLITRGDILEEIIADVGSEYGEEKPAIQKTGDNCWLIDGSASLEDINYELDLDLEADGADRIAGWFSAYTEHIPRVGEIVEAQGCRVTVQRIRKTRITLLELEKKEKERS